jgi:hypothetical protein
MDADSERSKVVGRVEAILVAPEMGAPMEVCQSAELVAARGIEGDRYLEGKGYWSDPKWPDQELTLVEAEVAEDLQLAPEQLRRNLVTRGVRLADLIDRRFRIGAALLKGVRPCDPCAYIEGFTRPGMARALAGRGGLRAHIEAGGAVVAGDEIRLEP